ncbi:helix-turn-helix domain-containing protein [Ralstonia pseudosolanacearum]
MSAVALGPDENLRAETTWFHIFRSMFSSRDAARMGPYAVTVYLVIKAHANFHTGNSFPSIELIADETGISRSQVIRVLKVLETSLNASASAKAA